VNHEGKDTFKCRVSHVPEVLHSGVEVLLNNKLVASARLIGSSQLPHSAQVAVIPWCWKNTLQFLTTSLDLFFNKNIELYQRRNHNVYINYYMFYFFKVRVITKS